MSIHGVLSDVICVKKERDFCKILISNDKISILFLICRIVKINEYMIIN